MTDIHNRIMDEMAAFQKRTGKAAQHIYIGRSQMAELAQWAFDHAYISTPNPESIEEDSRPEVGGLLVYKVNAETHLACA